MASAPDQTSSAVRGASARCLSVTPPAEWFDQRTRTRRYRVSMWGWWVPASTTSASRAANRIASGTTELELALERSSTSGVHRPGGLHEAAVRGGAAVRVRLGRPRRSSGRQARAAARPPPAVCARERLDRTGRSLGSRAGTSSGGGAPQAKTVLDNADGQLAHDRADVGAQAVSRAPSATRVERRRLRGARCISRTGGSAQSRSRA